MLDPLLFVISVNDIFSALKDLRIAISFGDDAACNVKAN